MHVPGRTPELADWVADVAGLLFGYRMMLRVVERESGNLEAEETV
jgi:VanZ family protein